MMTAPTPPTGLAAPDLAEARFRKDLYVLVSALLVAPPAQPIVEALTHGEMIQALRELGLGDAATRLEARGRLGPGGSTDLDRQEYFALLAVPTGRYLTPFESVFCDDREIDDKVVRGLLAGPSTRAVEQCFEQAGFKLMLAELPDHIGCETGFLAELWRREIDASASGDIERASAWAAFRAGFVRDHAARWIPQLCDRIVRGTSSDLLAGVALLLNGLLRAEAGFPAP